MHSFGINYDALLECTYELLLLLFSLNLNIRKQKLHIIISFTDLQISENVSCAIRTLLRR